MRVASAAAGSHLASMRETSLGQGKHREKGKAKRIPGIVEGSPDYTMPGACPASELPII